MQNKLKIQGCYYSYLSSHENIYDARVSNAIKFCVGQPQTYPTLLKQLQRVWRLQHPDVHLFPLGVLAAFGGGCISPCLALVYGGAIGIFPGGTVSTAARPGISGSRRGAGRDMLTLLYIFDLRNGALNSSFLLYDYA